MAREHVEDPEELRRARHLRHAGGRSHDVRPGRVIAFFLVIIALLLVALGVSLKTSADRAKSITDRITADYATLQSQLASADSSGARTTVQSIATECADLKVEVSGIQWEIASKVPVYGEDVEKVRALASVAQKLSGDAAVPVVNAYCTLIDDGIVTADGFDQSKLTTFVGDVSNLLVTMQESKTTVDECASTLDGLGTAHDAQLNGAISTTRSDVDDLASALDSINPVVTGADKMSSIIEMLTK